MSERLDIYNFPKHLLEAERRVSGDCLLSENNKEKIFEYVKHCYAKGLSTSRIIKYLNTLRFIAALFNKDFVDVDKDDILNLLVKINQMENRADWTKRDYKLLTKVFLKWLGKSQEAEIIKAGRGPRCTKIPEELLTEHELLKMLYIADNKRDRALIACLYESGGRIGEIAGLRIKHIQFDRYGSALIVDGKTGMRPIHVIFSASYIEDWLVVHPTGSNPDSPVWVCHNSSNNLNYPAIAKMLKTVAKRAGVKKRIYPHLFRHSRSTFLANHLTELQMDEYLGWVPGSNMPRTYVHLTQKNVKKALLEIYGLSFQENEKSLLVPIVCTNCGKINGPTFDSCIRCGAALRDGDSVLPGAPVRDHQGDRKEKVFLSSPSAMISPISRN